MKKSIGIILMVLLFLSMATGLGIAIGALIATTDELDSNAPYIKDGTWWIGDTDTGIVAEGKTPVIEIVDGYWYINGQNTGYKAQGESGIDGSTPEFTVVDGYWCINGTVTDIPAVGADGADGKTHDIKIGDDGYWYIDGVNTGVKAQGESKPFGVKSENGWIYIQNENGKYIPIWNLEYGVDNTTDASKKVIEEKIAELETIKNGNVSDKVKDIIDSAIEELSKINTTIIDSVDQFNELKNEVNDLVNSTNSSINDQFAKEITVIFVINSEQVGQCIVEKGNTIDELEFQSQIGYTLKWYYDDVEFDFTTIVNENLILNGVYEANTYSIKYVVDNKELDTTEDYKYGDAAVVTIETPEKEGYKFNCWVDENNVAYETKPMPVNGITLYATWTANSYKVEYNLGYENDNYDNLEVTYNEKYQLVSPERKGYKFIGWYYEGELVETQGNAWLIAKDVELVAKWEGYKVSQTINSNSITFSVDAIDEGQIKNTNTIEIIIKVKTSEVSELNGKSLIQDSKELSVKSSVDGDYTIYVITFYAEEELTAEINTFAELTVTLSSGVESVVLEVIAINVNASGEYLGALDVEYNNSIVIERSL